MEPQHLTYHVVQKVMYIVYMHKLLYCECKEIPFPKTQNFQSLLTVTWWVLSHTETSEFESDLLTTLQPMDNLVTTLCQGGVS